MKKFQSSVLRTQTCTSFYFVSKKMPSLPASSVNFTHLCLWMLLNCTNIFATYFWTVQVCSVRDIDKRLFFFLFTNIIFVLYALIVHFYRIAYTKAYARNWQILISTFPAISQNWICIEKLYFIYVTAAWTFFLCCSSRLFRWLPKTEFSQTF